MDKFTANYCYSNSNFIISNLPNNQKVTPYTNIIHIVQNLVTRGNPTIASKFLRDALGLERDYLDSIKQVKFISQDKLNWKQTIKGDVTNDDYPAEQFYNDLDHILNRISFIRNLTVAEYPISDILPNTKQVFNKQMVDFYIPLIKTVIEVDGSGHKRQAVLDRKRDSALTRAGIKVVRINTSNIRNKDYEQFKNEFRDIYRNYKNAIEDYYNYLNIDPSDFDTQVKLTAIARLQVLVLELIDRDVLSFKSKTWHFNLTNNNLGKCLELALKDLQIWIGHIAALFNMNIDMPHIRINILEKDSEITPDDNGINIDIDLYKRWDDSIKQANVYHIRTDFEDDANYFSVKVNEPVVYSLKVEMHKQSLEFLLENLFGFERFNEGQLEIIINSLNGEDTVGLLPTGGGKSLTYQLCVMLQPALSFVVVPIKSLMFDQINNINNKNHITHASFTNGDLTPDEADKRLRDFANGKYFFLIISPERFQSKKFREELSLVNVSKALSYAVIDEVHCLSEWGHDFRTSYLVLANTIRKYAPSTRFLALTATASSKVLKDVMTELEIESSNVITISNFTRKELTFNILKVNKASKKNSLIEYIKSVSMEQNIENTKGASIVFTQTVDGPAGCYDLSHFINSSTGLQTGFYSGRPPKAFSNGIFLRYKDEIQESFMNDEIDVLVATKAFGMGIDKGNIRNTIHYGIPNSLESFYQEAGRAGRDRKKSNCVVVYSPDQLDKEQQQNIFGIKTSVALLEKEKRKVNGDLNTLLFFLSTNLKDIEDEVEQIYKFYLSHLNTNEETTILLDYHNDRDRELYEKSIYRLALLGVVEDWTLDWKSRQVQVVIVNWTEDTVINKLSTHIQKYDYMFTLKKGEKIPEHYAEIIEHYYKDNGHFLKKILFVLLKWYNDNVIYSRKRSLLLMKEYADDFTDSESLQRKIEVYFKRNDDVYLLEQIVAEKDRLRDWAKIFYVQEEGKADQPRALSTFKSLKITVSRFLESYNNDISLNLTNGLINLVEGQFESIDGRERMSLAVREISQMETELREEMLVSILNTSDAFLNSEQKSYLSEVLISNGFDLMEDLKVIYSSLEDRFSYGSMIKTLHSTIREKSYGGYPWEK